MIDLNLLLDISKYIYAATFVFDSAVLLMVLLYKNARRFHYYFILAIGFGVFWEITFWIALFVKLSPLAILTSNRLAFAAGPFILYFILIFIHKFYGRTLLRKYLLIILFLITFISGIACLTDILLMDISYYGSATYEYSLIKSPAIIWYYISYGPISIAIFYVMYKILRDITDHRKRQAQYVVWGLLFSFILGTVNNIWIPLLFNMSEGFVLKGNINILVVSLQVIGAIALTIWTSLTAYAITRHRLFDIHFILRRWFTESVIVVTVIALGLAALYFIVQQIDGQLHTFIWLAFPLLIGGYFLVSRLLQMHRYRSDIDFSIPQELIGQDITEKDIHNVMSSLFQKLNDLYGLECTAAIYDWHGKYYRDISKKPNAPIALIHPLIAYLQVNFEPIFLSELKEHTSVVNTPEHARAIMQLFKQFKAHAAIPLRDSFGLLGVVFVSETSDVNTIYSRNAITNSNELGKTYGEAIQHILTFQALANQQMKKQ